MAELSTYPFFQLASGPRKAFVKQPCFSTMDPEKIGRPPNQEFQTERICDGCTSTLEGGDYVATYFCDTKWGATVRGKFPVIAQQESYCLTCYTDSIPLPREGTREGFTFEVLQYHPNDEVYTFDEKRVMRYSGESEGIQWSPPNVYETLFPFEISELDFDITPMSTFIVAYNQGVDLRGFVTDGVLKIPDSALPVAQEILRQNVERRPKFSFDADSL